MCALDFLLLVAFVVGAVVLGKPLSYLNCFAVCFICAAIHQDAFVWRQRRGQVCGLDWLGVKRADCFESKSVWGLCIALW